MKKLKKIYIRLRPQYWLLRWRVMRIVCHIIGCKIYFNDPISSRTYCIRCGTTMPHCEFSPFNNYINKEKSILYKIKKFMGSKK